MIWPGLLFNLGMGLVFAAYLLRAVRRFDRRADALMARLDREYEAYLARLDREHEAYLAKYDTARDEIRASLRAKTDRAIAEMMALAEHRPVAQTDAETSLNGVHDPGPSLDRGVEPHPAAPFPPRAGS
jgi:hypothetical protein